MKKERGKNVAASATGSKAGAAPEQKRKAGAGVKVRTGVKAGGLNSYNHNRLVVR